MGVPGEVHVTVQPNHGNVIIQVTGVEVLVNKNVGGVKFNVSVKFRIIIDIPLSKSNPKEKKMLTERNELIFGR